MSDEHTDRVDDEGLPTIPDERGETDDQLPDTVDADSTVTTNEKPGSEVEDGDESKAGDPEKTDDAVGDTSSDPADGDTTQGETSDGDIESETSDGDIESETSDGDIESETSDGDLPPQDLARAFGVLEEAFTSDALGTRQLDQLLTVLERVMTNPGETDPETLAELVSMLEELIVEPDDIDEVDVENVLSIFEEAIPGLGVDEEDVAAVFDVVEEVIRDPASIDPDDVERFRSGIEGALLDVTDPSSGGFGVLFPFAGLAAADRTEGVADENDGEVDMFRLARIAAGMTQRATDSSMESGIRTGTRMAYAAANAQSPVELVTNARAIALDELQRAGVDIGDEQETWLDTHRDDVVETRPVTRERLEERGKQLLERSAEIGLDESLHPSFPVILDQLASDEARILRLLATEGPQGALDVYDRQYIPYRRRLVAENLTMLGTDAGCRNKLRTPVYLQNLDRLGLVQVVNEPIETLKSYQILEAQPHVEQARERAKRPKMAYKRVELTDFGVEFCELCFPFAVEAEPRGMGLRREADEES